MSYCLPTATGVPTYFLLNRKLLSNIFKLKQLHEIGPIWEVDSRVGFETLQLSSVLSIQKLWLWAPSSFNTFRGLGSDPIHLLSVSSIAIAASDALAYLIYATPLLSLVDLFFTSQTSSIVPNRSKCSLSSVSVWFLPQTIKSLIWKRKKRKIYMMLYQFIMVK